MALFVSNTENLSVRRFIFKTCYLSKLFKNWIFNSLQKAKKIKLNGSTSSLFLVKTLHHGGGGDGFGVH
jgi:hypothetical protein